MGWAMPGHLSLPCVLCAPSEQSTPKKGSAGSTSSGQRTSALSKAATHKVQAAAAPRVVDCPSVKAENWEEEPLALRLLLKNHLRLHAHEAVR